MTDWPHEQRAAYLAHRKPGDVDRENLDDHILELVMKIQAIWEQWQQMKGKNPPLERSTAGLRRDFDINLDGMAHYSMLPDLLQDICNVGLTPQDLAPLFRSAYDYVLMWEKCSSKAAHFAT